MNIPEFHTQHVFIVGEDEQHHQLVREAIGELPYLVHVSVVSDGKEGIAMLKNLAELPDVVFLDLELSLGDGLACLREVKGDNRLASLPVIIFSASSYPSVINEAYEAGAHLFISKSVNGYEPKKLVHHLLSINWKEKILPPPREEFVVMFTGH
jgi:CheY-like chemotaxis protein